MKSVNLEVVKKAHHYQEKIRWKNNPREACDACLLVLWLIVDQGETMAHSLKVSCKKYGAKPGRVRKMTNAILPENYVKDRAQVKMTQKLKESIRQRKIEEYNAKKFQKSENPPAKIEIEKRMIEDSFVDVQEKLMICDPRDGAERPYPSSAQHFRDYHGCNAWIFNPWTTKKRDTRDIGTDVEGKSIVS